MLNALHSGSQAASASPDDAGGLQPILFLARMSRVTLTMNIWQQVGLCNGAAGTVSEILYKTSTKPPDLPLAILVDFDTYTGSQFLTDNPKCVPIPPTCFEWTSNGSRLSRQQVPLQLRYAITIHKSQGPDPSISCHRHWQKRACSRMYICCFIKSEEAGPYAHSTNVMATYPGH